MSTYYRLTPIEEEKPNCWETGNWDGKRSDPIFVIDKDGRQYAAVCYQGVIDGSEFCDFYDCNDFMSESITHWLKPVNPVEALIEKYEAEISEQRVRLKNAALDSWADRYLPEIIEEKIKFINDLKNI